MTRINLIVAKAANNVIGNNNALPWHLPEDLAHFKRTTNGHPILMGRKTYESIGRPLPNRRNIVITRNPGWTAPGLETAQSIEEALELCKFTPEIFVIGGAQLYSEMLPHVNRLIVTELNRTYPGDTFFPTISSEFREISRESHQASSDETLQFDLVVYERQSTD